MLSVKVIGEGSSPSIVLHKKCMSSIKDMWITKCKFLFIYQTYQQLLYMQLSFMYTTNSFYY